MPQASGLRAYTKVYNSKPDGYTIGDFISGHLYEFTLGKTKPPFDLKKFTWLLTSNKSIYCIVTPKDGLATWEELIAASKKEPPLKWGVALYGSSMHVNSAWVKEEAGIEQAKLLILPGAAGVVSALIRKDIDMALIPINSARPIIDSKDANVVVTFTEERYFPDVPTIGEKGFPQFSKYTGGYRLVMGPPDMDPEAYRILASAAEKMFDDPKYQEQTIKQGSLMSPLAGEEVKVVVNDRIKFYETIAPVLKKHIK
jgi:tripartite-type tricarboxylate transporter receptor subunit TctC